MIGSNLCKELYSSLSFTDVSLVSITWKTFAVALVESTTKQVDNLVLPLFTYMLFSVSNE